jgi:predicted enzyme related to lactoylglutathione lyase
MLGLYRALGLNFKEEQHGSGPIHHSCDLGGTILEIYPGTEGGDPDRRASGATSLGFRVPSVDGTLSTLEKIGVSVIVRPKDSEWGRRAVIADPDGRAVEISQSI